jgi:hypothetical protein
METPMTDNKMYKEILLLKKLVLDMKEDLEDRFLTAEEELRLEESLREFREGKTISLKELKKELCMK